MHIQEHQKHLKWKTQDGGGGEFTPAGYQTSAGITGLST